MITRLLLLGLAGALGTLARYALTAFVRSTFASQMPWGTWLVNILGCFLFGLVWAMSEDFPSFSPEARLVVLVGFMGAFTTFSTYIFENAALYSSGLYLSMALNILGQNILGFAMFFLGASLVRFWQ